MERKAFSGLMLALLVTNMLTLAFNIERAGAGGTIYILPNGTVVGTTNIQRNGYVYTFTDNIFDSIVVQRDNIVIDGAGFVLAGGGSGMGIDLAGRSNVTVHNVIIVDFAVGIFLGASSNNNLYSNIVEGCLLYGIWLNVSNNNILSGNTASNNDDYGIYLGYSDNNTLSGNTISYNNQYGMYLYVASNNKIFHNNFIDNTNQAYDWTPLSNDWHHPTLLEGNYWSDYAGADDGSGVGKHAIAGDGIGDTLIPHPDTDYDFYPLMDPYEFTHDIAVISVTLSKTVVGQGRPMSISVTVENQGNFPCACIQTFNVTTYYGNATPTPQQWDAFWSMGDVNRDGYINIDDVALISAAWYSEPGDPNWNPDADLNGDLVVNEADWDIFEPNLGLDIWTYISTLTPEQWEIFWSMGDANRNGYIDMTDYDIIASAWGTTPEHPDWCPWADLDQSGDVDIGDLMTCGINFGLEIWTYFISGGVIETQTIYGLCPGASITLTFTWDTTGVPYANYTISAYAVPIFVEEDDRADNNYSDGAVTVTITGDVDGDGDVDWKDFGKFATAFGSKGPPQVPVPDPNYNPNCDFDNDGDVDWEDFGTFATNYGKSVGP